MKSLIIILIITLTSSAALAVDSGGNYAVWGLGKKSCFGYSQAIAGDDVEKYKHYIRGFLTAYNIFTEKTYSITGNMNVNDIVDWVQEYCSENPMSGLETALINFTFEHYDKRMKSSGASIGR